MANPQSINQNASELKEAKRAKQILEDAITEIGETEASAREILQHVKSTLEEAREEAAEFDDAMGTTRAIRMLERDLVVVDNMIANDLAQETPVAQTSSQEHDSVTDSEE